MIETLIICATFLLAIILVLGYLAYFGMSRKAFEASVLAKVEERLSKSTDYRKDLETVNANQLKLAQDFDLFKKSVMIKNTFAGRPPGSIV